jgi:hypothetical protein
MLILWTPKDADPWEFVFRVEELGPEEYEPIEAHGAWESVEAFDEAVRSGSRTAWRVALWICLRRETPDLDFDDVRPRPYDVVVNYEPAEQLLMAEVMLADPDLPAGTRSQLEASLPDLRETVGKDDPSTGPALSPPVDGPPGGTLATS